MSNPIQSSLQIRNNDWSLCESSERIIHGMYMWNHPVRGRIAECEYILDKKYNNTLDLKFDLHWNPGIVHIPVALTQTRPNYGGERIWFNCPECKHRTGALMIPYGGKQLLCRICGEFSYRMSGVKVKKITAFF